MLTMYDYPDQVPSSQGPSKENLQAVFLLALQVHLSNHNQLLH